MLDGPVRACTRCDLASRCAGPVPGTGSSKARSFWVGQSPGADEDGKSPFLGRSGQLLRETLSRFGIPIAEVYLTNAGKCHPAGNKKLTKAQQAACLPWLEAELALWQPPDGQGLIVAVGADALKALLPKMSLSEGRSGTMVDYAGHPLTAILHPAAVLRDARRRSEFEADVERIAIQLGYRDAAPPYWQHYELWTENIDERVRHILGCCSGVIGLDTEFLPDQSLIGYSISWAAGHAAYIPDASGLDLLLRSECTLAVHSAQSDIPVICRALRIPSGAFPYRRVVDTCIGAYVLREKSVALKDLTWQHYGIRTLHFEDVAKTAEEFAALDLATQTRYAAADADFARRLWLDVYAPSIFPSQMFPSDRDASAAGNTATSERLSPSGGSFSRISATTPTARSARG